MSKDQSKEQNSSNRLALIKIVKTPLAFYVLVALMMETAFGVLSAASTDRQIQRISLYGLVLVVLILVITVTALAIWKPDSLLGNFSASKEISAFCAKITGDWWERVKPDESTALSKVTITHNKVTNTVKLNGKAYKLNGELSSNWESEASCISLNDKKVFYFWKGRPISKPGILYEGFGEVNFEDSRGKSSSGNGVFSDINYADLKTFKWKSSRLRRCSSEELNIINKENIQEVTECVKQVITSMG